MLDALYDQVFGRDEGVLDDRTTMMAAFADSTYKDSKKRKWAAVKGSMKATDGMDHREWALDRTSVRDKHVTVWKNETTSELVIGYRGTDVEDPDDLIADAHILAGTTHASKRFKTAAKQYHHLKNVYPPDEWTHTLVGHSLGGTVNNHVYHKNKDTIAEVHNFNPGSSTEAVDATLNNIIKNKTDNKNVHQYFIKGDLISSFGQGDPSYTNHVFEPRKDSKNPHSLQQFLS